jgi:hypothetical protein
MKADPQSAWIYRNSVFPLTPLIMEAVAYWCFDNLHMQVKESL